MKNLDFAILGLVLVFVVGLATSQVSSDQSGGEHGREKAVKTRGSGLRLRDGFKLAKIWSFKQFKRSFRKRYRSVAEEIVRYKLFLCRSIRAFLSAVAYKFGLSTFYLAINNRSDWTNAELGKSSKHFPTVAQGSQQPVEGTPPTATEFQEGAKTMEPIPGQTEKIAKSVSIREWSAREFRLSRSEIEDDPNYRSIYLTRLIEGEERSYGHLPVKGNYKSLNADRNKTPRAIVDARFTNWFSYDGANTRTGPSADIVWVDHRQSGCMQPVQDQGQCDCCYAFAAIASLEWAYCKETGKKIKFSEQYMIDCGNGKPELFGCEGGALVFAGEFILNFGLELADRFPYRGEDSACPPEIQSSPFEFTGSISVNLTHLSYVELDLFEEYLQFSPILMVVAFTDEFNEYGGGVYDGRSCKGMAGSHAVLLVGHGREDGEEYWLLRNSFGTSWGELGYMKLNKNSDCIHPDSGFIYGSRDGKNVRLWPQPSTRAWTKGSFEMTRNRKTTSRDGEANDPIDAVGLDRPSSQQIS